jgi:hypothetical protein
MQTKPRAATPAVMMQLMMLKTRGTGRGKTRQPDPRRGPTQGETHKSQRQAGMPWLPPIDSMIAACITPEIRDPMAARESNAVSPLAARQMEGRRIAPWAE